MSHQPSEVVNLEPTYPEAELQTELRKNLIIGIVRKNDYTWHRAKLDLANDSAEPAEINEDIQGLLEHGAFRTVLEHCYGLILIKPIESIDRGDLISGAISSYKDLYKIKD